VRRSRGITTDRKLNINDIPSDTKRPIDIYEYGFEKIKISCFIPYGLKAWYTQEIYIMTRFLLCGLEKSYRDREKMAKVHILRTGKKECVVRRTPLCMDHIKQYSTRNQYNVTFSRVDIITFGAF